MVECMDTINDAHAHHHRAQTPSTSRNASNFRTLRYGIAPCWLGQVIVAVADRGICAIGLGDDPGTLLNQVQGMFPHASFTEAGSDLAPIMAYVSTCIAAPEQVVGAINAASPQPLGIQGTAFQQRVWQALREIPPGCTASYTDIAVRIGRPNAARAVGQACAANKLAVVIPCHRAVRSDGQLSGYRWDIERKRMLLLRERDTSAALPNQ